MYGWTETVPEYIHLSMGVGKKRNIFCLKCKLGVSFTDNFLSVYAWLNKGEMKKMKYFKLVPKEISLIPESSTVFSFLLLETVGITNKQT